ncbi:MAG: hypothetical protein ACQESN_11285 [Thermotogota bacterium]
MCGYCVEEAVISIIEQEIFLKKKMDEEQKYILLQESYAQETMFLDNALHLAKAVCAEKDFFYVLHSRALGEIAAQQNPYLKSSLNIDFNGIFTDCQDFISSRFNLPEITNILPHPSWSVIYTPDFIFSKEKNNYFFRNKMLKEQCLYLLEYYNEWWLKNGKNETVQSKKSEDEDEVEDHMGGRPKEEWQKFYILFPAIYLALNYIIKNGHNFDIIRKLAFNDVSAVPDFPGYDLWLQRKSFLNLVRLNEAPYLINSISQGIRPVLIFYVFIKLKEIRFYKNQIVRCMHSIIENEHINYEISLQMSEFAGRMEKY